MRTLALEGIHVMPLDFAWALACMKGHHKVGRYGWGDKLRTIAIQEPGANPEMTQPYLFEEYEKGHPKYPDGARFPYTPSQEDIFATDYYSAN